MHLPTLQYFYLQCKNSTHVSTQSVLDLVTSFLHSNCSVLYFRGMHAFLKILKTHVAMYSRNGYITHCLFVCLFSEILKAQVAICSRNGYVTSCTFVFDFINERFRYVKHNIVIDAMFITVSMCRHARRVYDLCL